MKLVELIEAADRPQVTARFGRFLISEGIIDPPSGGRAHASYSDQHLRKILTYVRLRESGFSLNLVRAILRSECGETVPIEVAPGLTLHVDLTRLDRSLCPAEAAAQVGQILSEIVAMLTPEGAVHGNTSRD